MNFLKIYPYKNQLLYFFNCPDSSNFFNYNFIDKQNTGEIVLKLFCMPRKKLN